MSGYQPKVRYIRLKNPSSVQCDQALASDLSKQGDLVAIWVNEMDILNMGQEILDESKTNN